MMMVIKYILHSINSVDGERNSREIYRERIYDTIVQK